MGNEVSIRCGDRTDTSFEDMLRKDYPANDASKARLTMMRSFLAREDMADASISLEAILSVYHKLWGINTQDDFMSLLHGVVWKSKLRCSRAVLAHPSLDVGVRNDKGETALLFALLYSRSDAVCELLLTKPAVRASVLVSDDDKAKALSTKHSTVSEALRMAAEANADCCILTHISQRYDGVLDVSDALVAFDGLRVRAASVATLYEASSRCERAVAASAKARREARKLRRWDAVVDRHLPDVRGTTVASPKPSDALEDALRAFYAVHAPQKAKDAPQIAAVFRRDFEAMDDRLFRKYGARLQLPNDAASSSDESSDDEAEAVLAAPGGFAALVGGCGDLPARPVFS